MEHKEQTSMNQQKHFEKEQLVSKFKSRAFRAGSFSTLAAILVVVIAVVLVLGVESLPTTLTKFDTTATKLFSLSDQSKQIAKGVTDEVTLYLVAQPSNEDPALSALLDRYAAVNSRIKVKHIDPIVTPNFFSQYTSDSLYENSLVVTCGERSQCINYNDIYASSTENYSETGVAETVFNGESYITSAIDFVTSDNLPVVYRLTGHGEAYMPSSMQSAIGRENIALKDLGLINQDAVPADAKAIVIYSPKSDLTDDETAKLLDYLNNGGKLLLVTDYQETVLPNLMSIAANYGLSPVNGIVMEADETHFLRGYAYYLLPTVNSHAITTPLRIGGYYVLMPLAQGILVGEAPRSTVQVTSLLDTSEKSYAKTEGYAISTFERETDDIGGPFSLGVAATEDCKDSNQAQFVWFTTSEMLQDNINTMVSGANHDLYLNALNWMCEKENSIAVHSKNVDSGQLTVPTSAATRWSLILIIGVPLVILGTGIYIVVLRKRR